MKTIQDQFSHLSMLNYRVHTVLLRSKPPDGGKLHYPWPPGNDFCYPAAEALYHLARESGIKVTPIVAHLRPKAWGPATRDTHWFVRFNDSQLKSCFDPSRGLVYTWALAAEEYKSIRGCGFLTKQPSRRAELIIATLRGTP